MGGAYLTLLNTLANVGVTVPKLFVFAGWGLGGWLVLLVGCCFLLFCWVFVHCGFAGAVRACPMQQDSPCRNHVAISLPLSAAMDWLTVRRCVGAAGDVPAAACAAARGAAATDSSNACVAAGGSCETLRDGFYILSGAPVFLLGLQLQVGCACDSLLPRRPGSPPSSPSCAVPCCSHLCPPLVPHIALLQAPPSA